MTQSAPRRWWLRPLIGVLVVVAAGAAAMAYLFFGQWTGVLPVGPAEIDQHFDAAVVEAGGGIPYIEIGDGGVVVVHREQESGQAKGFDTLTLLVWTPDDGRMLRVDYPRWFVRLKTSSSFNLGTMIAAARKDWGQWDLSVSYDDLVNRGPALLLNHRSEGGARVMLWTSVRPGK